MLFMIMCSRVNGFFYGIKDNHIRKRVKDVIEWKRDSELLANDTSYTMTYVIKIELYKSEIVHTTFCQGCDLICGNLNSV